ncbi:MAG: cytochrome c oxidase subunit 3 [Verrucomicrobia bacterium]|nr:cytochrome c oxidase subunit 3 [Verrucomicrobiota bacterium]MBV8277526.1 cytochrome c oxidase subunit 3 [Verrucomicrobiota bacterium]
MSNHRAILYEHFSDIEQQRETSAAGIWVFIASEIMFFGALILAFSVYRFNYPQAFSEGAQQLNVVLGAINTGVLFTSGLTMSLAAAANKMGARFLTLLLLLATAVLGAAFLAIKAFEYHEDWIKGLFPGESFHWTGSDSPQVQLFFLLYFIMTGFHAVHLIVGIGLILVVAWLVLRGWIHEEHFMPLEVAGIYWHFVDMVWIFLFTLLYLLGGKV